MKFFFITVIIFALSSCSHEDNKIRYEIQGASDNYDVTYIDKKGETVEKENIHNGVFYSFNTLPTNQIGIRHFKIHAVNNGGGNMTVTIARGTKVLASQTNRNSVDLEFTFDAYHSNESNGLPAPTKPAKPL